MYYPFHVYSYLYKSYGNYLKIILHWKQNTPNYGLYFNYIFHAIIRKVNLLKLNYFQFKLRCFEWEGKLRNSPFTYLSCNALRTCRSHSCSYTSRIRATRWWLSYATLYGRSPAGHYCVTMTTRIHRHCLGYACAYCVTEHCISE